MTGTGEFGTVYSNSGSLIINDTQISNNRTVSYGGGVYLAGGTLSMTDCTVSNNIGGDVGGIYLRTGTIVLTNVDIIGNSAVNVGGLYSSSGCTNVTINGGSVLENTATGYATNSRVGCAGIYIYQSPYVRLNGLTIAENEGTLILLEIRL